MGPCLMHKEDAMPKLKTVNQEQAARPPVPRVSLSVPDASISSGLSRSTLYALMGSGDLGYVKCGARRLILVLELEAMLARLAKRGEAA